jgi:hypothetical protein
MLDPHESRHEQSVMQYCPAPATRPRPHRNASLFVTSSDLPDDPCALPTEHKGLATYEAGLKHDPGNAELKEGMMRCIDAINRIAQGMGSEEEIAERRAKAMEDPEVQGILRDPIMQGVLEDLQTDPRAAQRHMSHPEIRNKISKLVTAGIIQLR